MFVNERKKPLRLRQAEALLNRLPKYHPKRPILEKDIAKRKAGFRGEQNLDYHLSFLRDHKYHILRDIELVDENTFQIDTLLLSSSYMLIIESKFISGTLFIDPYTNQLVRNYGGIEEAFSNPLNQVKRHVLQFENWLIKHKYPQVPIEYVVAYHETSSVFKSEKMNKKLFQRMIYSENILQKLSHFESLHQTTLLDNKKNHKLQKQIIQQNSSMFNDILKKQQLSLSDLIQGVQCPVCRQFGMKRISANWKCPSCFSKSKDAHIKTIEEFLLLNGSITNEQCRQFLGLESVNIAYKVLASLSLASSGGKKNRTYFYDPF